MQLFSQYVSLCFFPVAPDARNNKFNGERSNVLELMMVIMDVKKQRMDICYTMHIRYLGMSLCI